jgi:hypothetical protein
MTKELHVDPGPLRAAPIRIAEIQRRPLLPLLALSPDVAGPSGGAALEPALLEGQVPILCGSRDRGQLRYRIACLVWRQVCIPQRHRQSPVTQQLPNRVQRHASLDQS